MNPNTYLVSFIIPCFNTSEKILRCIESIDKLKIDFAYEIIIIDDCSTDPNTTKILELISKKYSAVIIKNNKNVGAGAARNIGLKKSKGKYIHFIDSDDTLHTGSLKKFKEIYASGIDAFLFRYSINKSGLDSITFDMDRPIYNLLEKKNLKKFKPKNHQWVLMLRTHIWNFIISKKFIERVGMRFTESYCLNDVFVFWTIFLESEFIYYINEPLVTHFYDNSEIQLTKAKGSRRLKSLYVFDECLKIVEKHPFSIPYFELSKYKTISWMKSTDPEYAAYYPSTVEKFKFICNTTFYIYGSGKKAELFFKNLDNKTPHILGFLDSDIKKSGCTLYGKKILHPSQIETGSTIVIASSFIKEITDLLHSLNQNNYFFMEECKLMLK